MSSAYPNGQWAFPPAYRPNGQSERDYNISVEGPQNVQRSFSDSTRQGQQFSGTQYSQTTSPSNTAFTSGGGQYSNQTSRSRSVDQLYVPEQMQPSQNHYMNTFDVGNALGATSRQGDFHTLESSFGFPSSTGSLLPADSETTRSEGMVAPYTTASPIPFQTSFPQAAPAPSAPQSYYHPPSSQRIASLPPQPKRPRTDPATDEDEELTLDSKEDVKVKSRACQRCKNLKVKCEFKTDTDPCKRCMNGGHECLIPGKKKRRTPPKREHLMNEIREQAERIRDLMGQLEDANKKLRQPGAMSDISSQGSAPSPPAAFSISPSSTTYQSLDGINTTSDSETNKNITDWISKAKESFAEFDVFLNGGAGAPQSYFEDRDAEDSPVEDDVDNLDDDDDDYEFAVVASDGEDMSGNAMKSSRVRRSSRSSVGSNLTRGSASGRKQEVTKKSAMVPNEAVPFGLMANLSIRKTRQRGASAEVEDVGVANDGFFASPGPGPAGARPHEMPSILARGIISTSEAEELFSMFYFDRMNLSLSLCDPILYTAQNTCARSAFMFTVICAIASRYYAKRPDLYDHLIVDAKMAAGAALIGGEKNVEMVIGYILLSLYPEPTRNWEDQRGWAYLGMAIRTAMDINLHLPNTVKPLHELHERQMLNRTRVWINCFNLDRSTGSQYGKFPIINNMDYTANHSEDWWRLSPYNMKNFDIHTSCYNAELRVMARFISRIYSDPKHPTGLNKDIDVAELATETDEELKCLEAKWMAILDQTDMSDPQNRFRTGLLRLAFSYARLASLSFGFQHAFGKNRNNETPSCNCLAAAYDVHNVILNDVGRPEQRIYLRHGPEAQIVFVTFASTFLIKLLQPKYATYIDAGQRSYIQQLVQGVIDLFGSPEVAVDERHGPKAYSRFLKGLLEMTLSEKVRQTSLPKVRQTSLPKVRRAKSAKSLNATEHSNSSSAYTSPMTASMSIAPSSPDVSMGYGFVPASMSTSLDGSYGNPSMQNFLTPDPEYFRPPLPFDDDILNSMQSLADPDSWALPGFDWMTNYRVPSHPSNS
ncbi:hypothetical protein CPB85DRAFT_1429060 [Mucidula mucida]|nr:hypothetical protein CPB85DRAFT_1429060 [Mucidula mucida]